MRTLYLWAFCCLLFISSRAQRDSLNQAFIDQRCFQVFIPTPADDNRKDIAGRFDVIDVRPDTSRLGFWGHGSMDRSEIMVARNANLSKAVARYLNTADKAAPDVARILVLIKKFWLYDTLTNSALQGNEQGDIEAGRLSLRVEAFRRTDEGLLPLTYLDTLVVLKKRVRKLTSRDQADLLDLFIHKIAAVDEVILKRRRIFSMEAIDSINNLRYAYAMDTATVLKEGVYATVDDFRNNAPSITDYTLEKDGKFSHLYLKDRDGHTYLTRSVWGYCDGQRCYAMLGGSLYPIIGVGHSFYVWGARQLKVKSFSAPVVVPMPGGLMTPNVKIGISAQRDMRFFSLDLQTGSIY